MDSVISNIQVTGVLPSESSLTVLFLPFSYFDQTLENQLVNIISSYKDAGDKINNTELLEKTIAFQNNIHYSEQKLLFGFECMLFCSLILGVTGIIVILHKNYTSKNEIIRKEAMNDAHLNFSRDLHDGVAQDLAALKLYIQNKDSEKSSFYANQALKEVRYLIDALHLNMEKPFSLILEEMLDSFASNYGIEIKYHTASENLNKLKQETQIEIFRIFQEILSNIARHANATLVTVKITDIGNSLNLTVSDNGIGFSEEKIPEDNRKHYGLSNIKERVLLLGGTVEFKSAEGTTIAINLKNTIH